MPGRRPTPTAIKELNGNPGKRPLNRSEPQPRKRRPKPPAHVADSPATLAEWRRLVKLLWPTGVLSEAEADLLGLYCVAYGQWVDAVGEVASNGMVLTFDGKPMQSPYMTIANNLAKAMKGYLVELGMTPASRSRIVVARDDQTDPLDAFLAGAYTATHEAEGGEDG